MTDQQLKIQLKNESGTGVSASFISVKISVNFILALNVVSLYHTRHTVRFSLVQGKDFLYWITKQFRTDIQLSVRFKWL